MRNLPVYPASIKGFSWRYTKDKYILKGMTFESNEHIHTITENNRNFIFSGWD